MSPVYTGLRLTEQTPERCEATWRLESCDALFEGHFPRQKILPGVVQLGAVKSLANTWLGAEYWLSGIAQMKFTLPLVPQDLCRLTLTAKPQLSGVLLSFTICAWRHEQWCVASQGKLHLALREGTR